MARNKTSVEPTTLNQDRATDVPKGEPQEGAGNDQTTDQSNQPENSQE